MIALLLIGFAIPALWQIPGLVRKRWWRELICFAVLWLMGLIFSMMVYMGINLPPISTVINKFITETFGM
jgi:hypothetical protein